MAQRIDQVLAGYADGDAISREARAFRGLFREMGFQSEIYAPAETIAPSMQSDARPVESFSAGSDDVLLYHFSITSSAFSVLAGFRGRRFVRYHNITPADFFAGYDDDLAEKLKRGRSELADVLKLAHKVLAVSSYNAGEAKAAGCRGVEVMELVADFADIEPDESRIDRFNDEMGNILFVGRIVPNKCIEELILAFRWINKVIEPRSRLILAGSDRSCPAYFAMLKMLAARLELENVCFEGFLDDAGLAASYSCADAFVCTSRHEGYCLPLVEAMRYEVPVIARDAGGMPEAMGGAGILFDELDSRLLGELVAKAVWDDDFSRRIVESQNRRVEALKARDLKTEWKKLLECQE